jgi:hypothetical protein
VDLTNRCSDVNYQLRKGHIPCKELSSSPRKSVFTSASVLSESADKALWPSEGGKERVINVNVDMYQHVGGKPNCKLTGRPKLS